MKEDILEKNIALLLSEQQQAVRTCFEAAKVKNPREKRYETR